MKYPIPFNAVFEYKNSKYPFGPCSATIMRWAINSKPYGLSAENTDYVQGEKDPLFVFGKEALLKKFWRELGAA